MMEEGEHLFGHERLFEWIQYSKSTAAYIRLHLAHFNFANTSSHVPARLGMVFKAHEGIISITYGLCRPIHAQVTHIVTLLL